MRETWSGNLTSTDTYHDISLYFVGSLHQPSDSFSVFDTPVSLDRFPQTLHSDLMDLASEVQRRPLHFVHISYTNHHHAWHYHFLGLACFIAAGNE
jgi:hypothetical protein